MTIYKFRPQQIDKRWIMRCRRTGERQGYSQFQAYPKTPKKLAKKFSKKPRSVRRWIHRFFSILHHYTAHSIYTSGSWKQAGMRYANRKTPINASINYRNKISFERYL